ncbi:MAG: RnfABCDGE type electron transport complex subunit D [Alphaproteobacteria bacterium]|nr:RnfABCDGE type electron transport complex subunit D [Alphaproteobacteria bacterium]
MLKVSTAPHMYTPTNTVKIMQDVIISLIPAGLVGIAIFGLNALITIVTAVVGCVAMEYVACKYILKVKPSTKDLSAIVTGLLLAYNLPCNMPIWMTLIGCFVAIIIAKVAFGGIGKNLFNPALIGRVFLFISFPIQMTTWVEPKLFDFMNTDASTSATTLGILKHAEGEISASNLTSLIPDYTDMFLGYTGGSMGEVSAIALLLGLFYLLYRRVVSWHIPFFYVATFFALTSGFYYYTGDNSLDPVTHLLSGGLFLGAFFMATDYTTSPMSKKGKIIFAIGCGVLTFVIRRYSAYPEGVSFAILIMNAFVPLIDKFARPRAYGTRRK